ncbi:MAG: hypothetical protein LUD15_04880 [Bacteroides sp.]|nr:hypothetical protein [Bacteroides sp.]
MRRIPLDDNLLALMLSQGYVMLPRIVLYWMYCKEDMDREMGYVYGALFSLACYSEYEVEYQHRDYVCKPGEVLVSYRYLARITGLYAGKVTRIIDSLEQLKYITKKPVYKGWLFEISHYKEITQSAEYYAYREKKKQGMIE